MSCDATWPCCQWWPFVLQEVPAACRVESTCTDTGHVTQLQHRQHISATVPLDVRAAVNCSRGGEWESAAHSLPTAAAEPDDEPQAVRSSA